MSLGTIVVVVIVGLAALFAVSRMLGVEVHRREPEREFAPGKRLELVRNITRRECPWLRRDMPAGTIVFEYRGPTYGLKEYEELIFVSHDGGTPFFQLPLDGLVQTDDSPPGRD